MVEYKIYFTNQAQKDAKKISASNLKPKVMRLIDIIKKNPFGYPPKYEILTGDLVGLVSRRINKQHRLVYQVIDDEKAIKILRMWTHYE